MMHLVHSQTIQLHDFIGEYIPPYAILSHRWENEEITYTDMQRGSRRKRRSKAGYAKLKKSCAQASKDGLEYVWIDTCCIDKSSSAELSEAINSMFKWYRDANICYAYLSDVRFWFPENPEAVSHFQASMWFTRGWTLQELIAPKIVNFFMCGPTGWDLVGSKNDLLSILAGSTGINESVLRGEDFRNCSVATRMSWAARRVTTRAEDLAYCLLGLFDVNMPLLYGEGEKAFIRLQEEIMRGSDDHSLFVWRSKSSKTSKMTSRLSGLLADSPSQFRDCPTLVSLPDFASSVPYSMTNRGLQIELPLVEGSNGTCFAMLKCSRSGPYQDQVALPLVRLTDDEGLLYARNGNFVWLSHGDLRNACKRIFVRQEPAKLLTNLMWHKGTLVRINHKRFGGNFEPRHLIPEAHQVPTDDTNWDQHRLIPSPYGQGVVTFVSYYDQVVVVSFDSRDSPACKIFFTSTKYTGNMECLPSVQRLLVELKNPIDSDDEAPLVSPSVVNRSRFFESVSSDALAYPTTCPNSFEYLDEDYTASAQIKRDIVRGHQMVVLDIILELRQPPYGSQGRGPFELDALENEVAVNEDFILNSTATQIDNGSVMESGQRVGTV